MQEFFKAKKRDTAKDLVARESELLHFTLPPILELGDYSVKPRYLRMMGSVYHHEMKNDLLKFVRNDVFTGPGALWNGNIFLVGDFGQYIIGAVYNTLDQLKMGDQNNFKNVSVFAKLGTFSVLPFERELLEMVEFDVQSGAEICLVEKFQVKREYLDELLMVYAREALPMLRSCSVWKGSLITTNIIHARVNIMTLVSDRASLPQFTSLGITQRISAHMKELYNNVPSYEVYDLDSGCIGDTMLRTSRDPTIRMQTFVRKHILKKGSSGELLKNHGTK